MVFWFKTALRRYFSILLRILSLSDQHKQFQIYRSNAGCHFRQLVTTEMLCVRVSLCVCARVCLFEWGGLGFCLSVPCLHQQQSNFMVCCVFFFPHKMFDPLWNNLNLICCWKIQNRRRVMESSLPYVGDYCRGRRVICWRSSLFIRGFAWIMRVNTNNATAIIQSQTLLQ